MVSRHTRRVKQHCPRRAWRSQRDEDDLFPCVCCRTSDFCASNSLFYIRSDSAVSGILDGGAFGEVHAKDARCGATFAEVSGGLLPAPDSWSCKFGDAILHIVCQLKLRSHPTATSAPPQGCPHGFRCHGPAFKEDVTLQAVFALLYFISFVGCSPSCRRGDSV
jgi:hypothetical protein